MAKIYRWIYNESNEEKIPNPISTTTNPSYISLSFVYTFPLVFFSSKEKGEKCDMIWKGVKGE